MQYGKYTYSNLYTVEESDMSKVITFRVSKEFSDRIEYLARESGLDKSTLLRKAIEEGIKEVSIKLAIEKLKSGEISLWKAAELAGLSVWEFIDEIRKRRIVIYTEEDLMEDIRVVERGI